MILNILRPLRFHENDTQKVGKTNSEGIFLNCKKASKFYYPSPSTHKKTPLPTKKVQPYKKYLGIGSPVFWAFLFTPNQITLAIEKREQGGRGTPTHSDFQCTASSSFYLR